MDTISFYIDKDAEIIAYVVDKQTPLECIWIESYDIVDSIIYTTVEIDLETGNLIWRKPSSYSLGTILLLQNSNLASSVSGRFDYASMAINTQQELIATTE